MQVTPFPKTEKGFIDEAEVIKIAYNKLKLPYGTLDNISPYELYIMYEGHEENERDELESLYTIIRIGVSSAMSGKKIDLFKDDKNKQGNNGLPPGQITEEERIKTLEELDSIFK